MLSGYSQELSIDPQTGLITISQDQAIVLANIVQNEKRLGFFVDSLRVELSILHDSIAIFADRAAESRKRLQDIQFRNDTLRLQLLELEKERSEGVKSYPKGLYAWFSADNGNNQVQPNYFLGAMYLYDRFIFAVGIDPFIKPNPVYSFGLGFKIF